MFDTANPHTDVVMTPALRTRLWQTVLPKQAQDMLAKGVPMTLVRPLFEEHLSAFNLEYDLLRAVTGTDPYYRDTAATHRWCINVTDVCDAAGLTYNEMFGAIPASAVKISMSGGSVASKVSWETWYVPSSIPGREVEYHPGYELVSVMLPLTVWYLLNIPGQGEEVGTHGDRREYDDARVMAERVAAAYAHLIGG